MHIDRVELYRVPLSGLPALANVAGPRESVFAGLTSGDTVGWGEVTLGRAPLGSAEWSAGAMACLRDWLAPALVGREIASGADLQQALGRFQGNTRAKAALDMAWWNLASLKKGQPLYELLGGRKTPIRLSAALPVMNTLDDLLAAIRAQLDAGSETITLKFRPGWDLQMVRAVRHAFPSEPIAIDCDGQCALAQQEMFYRLEDFFLKSIEQPFAADDLVGHAMLQESLRTPIRLDQSVTSLARVEQAIDLGSCRAMRIDPARVGGLTPALAIRAACEAAQIPCALGGPPQGALAAHIAVALATLPNFSGPAEGFSLTKEGFLVVMPSAAAIGEEIEKEITPGDDAGAGVRVDAERLAQVAVERAVIG